MVQAALHRSSVASLRSAQLQKRYPRQSIPQTRGQVAHASDPFIANRLRRQTLKTQTELATLPQERSPVDEQHFKREMAQKRHMDRMREQHFALPPELDALSQELNDEETEQVDDWYQDELQQGGLKDMVAAQIDQRFAKPVRDMVDKRIDELKKKAFEKVKAKAEEAFGKVFKKSASKGVKKTVWSAVDQGAAVEVEGAALESWFSFGTLMSSWQGLTGALNSGKPFIPEGTIISWVEPPPLTVPSGKQPQNVAEGVDMLTGLYDLFAWLLIPIYWFLLVLIILLIHVAFLILIMQYLLFATAVTFLGILTF